MEPFHKREILGPTQRFQLERDLCDVSGKFHGKLMKTKENKKAERKIKNFGPKLTKKSAFERVLPFWRDRKNGRSVKRTRIRTVF